MMLWHENLRRLIDLVEQQLAEAQATEGEFDSSDYSVWRARRDAADARIIAFFTEQENARFSERPPHDYRVQMAGIRSTSTSGYRGALRNWRATAHKRLGEAGR